MEKVKLYLSKLFNNKFIWELLLAALMISMAIIFIKEEQVDFVDVQKQLEHTNVWYVFIGIMLTILYIICQAQMYSHSFRALNKKVPLMLTVELYLKRNLISVFLPAGGFSSLAFFTKKIEKRGITKPQIHLASAIFAFCGILSVVVVAVPTLGVAILLNHITIIELAGFGILVLLMLGLILFCYSIAKKGWAYKLLGKLRPSAKVLLDEMIMQKVSAKQFTYVLMYSVFIEFIGIIHLYISMLALGFEASWTASIIGYIVMVVILIVSPFLRGMGAIEASLTFVLLQFGLPPNASISIILIYRFFEFWLPLFIGAASFFANRDNLFLRLLPALIIFVLGFINIVSAITPAIPTRLKLVTDFLPAGLVNTSTVLVLIFGLFLIILSVFLFRGSERAWYAGLLLTGLSFTGHLIKGADYEEASLSLVSFLILFYTRRSYNLRPNPKLTRISYQVMVFSLLSVFIYGVTGFYFINKEHFGTEFNFIKAVEDVSKLMFLFNSSELTPHTELARLFLLSIYCAEGMVIIFIAYGIMKPHFEEPYNNEEDIKTAKDIVERYGKSPLDFFKTYPDKFYFFSDDRDAFISFRIAKHFAIVLEDPVCKDEQAFINIVKKFDNFCTENGFISAYYRIPGQSLNLYYSLGKRSMIIGEEAVVDLNGFSLEGSKMKPTRNALNRLAIECLEVKIYHAPISEGLLQKLEHVSDEWLRSLNKKEVAFTQGIFNASILKGQTIVTVENKEEKVFAFLNLVPDYAVGEATYDLIRKINNSPNGILDLLLVKTFLYLKDQGYQYVNMGLAPLSGMGKENIAEKTIKYAYDNVRAFGHFKGLRKYKEKFFPRWEKKYLIYNHNYHLIQVPNALKKVSENN